MLLDSNGVPYTLGELVVTSGVGVRLDDFVVPKQFEMPDSIYARQEEGKTGASFHYGYELSHHSQQLLVLKYLRDGAGFDDVVWCNTVIGKDKVAIVLRLSDGLWCEMKEVVL